MKKLLEHYNVSSLEELEELIKNEDERVVDLIEFLDYYNLQEMKSKENENSRKGGIK